MFASIVANLSAFQQLIDFQPPKPEETSEELKKVIGLDVIDPEGRINTQKDKQGPPADPDKKPVSLDNTDSVENIEDQEDLEEDNVPSIDIKAIDEAVLETLLPDLTEINPDFDVSVVKSVDDFKDAYKKQVQEGIKNDPEFKSKLKAELAEELGLSDEIIEQVTNVKRGIDIKKHNELSQMNRFVDLDFETPDEIQKLFQVYYSVNKIDKANAERLLDLDMKSTPEEIQALVSERKQLLKNHIAAEFSALDENRNQAFVKLEESKSEIKKKMDSCLTSRVIGGQKRTQEEVDLYLEMTAPGTTEIILPTGEKKMVSRYQAYKFNKENDFDSFFPELFQDVLDVGNGIADIKEKVRRNSVSKGAFAKNLQKRLNEKGYSGAVVKNKKQDTPASSKSNGEAFEVIIGKK